MSALVEDHEFIDLGVLTRAGLFSQPATKSALVVKLNNRSVKFVKGPDETSVRAIFFTHDRRPKSQIIHLIECPTPYGTRRYFLCPKTNKRCNRLYLVKNALASREGHGLQFLCRSRRPDDMAKARALRVADQLRGSAGRGPARGAKRLRLLQELSAVRGAPWLTPDLADTIKTADQQRLRARAIAKQRAERDVRRAQREEKASRLAEERVREEARYAEWLAESLDPYHRMYDRVSTEAALQEGAKTWSEDRVLRYFDAALKAGGGSEFIQSRDYEPGEPDLREIKCHIEIETLQGRGLLEPGARRAAALRWSIFNRGMTDYALLVIDGLQLGHMSMTIWRMGDDGETAQSVRLAPRGSGQWAFACPISGEVTDTLYLRNQRFGSLKAQRLFREKPQPYRGKIRAVR